MVGTIDKKTNKKKKEVKGVLDNLVATHVLSFFLAKCHKHKQTLKKEENKFEKI